MRARTHIHTVYGLITIESWKSSDSIPASGDHGPRLQHGGGEEEGQNLSLITCLSGRSCQTKINWKLPRIFYRVYPGRATIGEGTMKYAVKAQLLLTTCAHVVLYHQGAAFTNPAPHRESRERDIVFWKPNSHYLFSLLAQLHPLPLLLSRSNPSFFVPLLFSPSFTPNPSDPTDWYLCFAVFKISEPALN